MSWEFQLGNLKKNRSRTTLLTPVMTDRRGEGESAYRCSGPEIYLNVFPIGNRGAKEIGPDWMDVNHQTIQFSDIHQLFVFPLLSSGVDLGD